MRREASFQTKFSRYLRYGYTGPTAAFELKFVEGNSVPFNALRTHQRDSLLAAKHGRLVYKIPDDSVGFKPFDCFALKGTDAFVVIGFGDGRVFLIDIDDWCREEKESERKSLTVERAEQLARIRASMKKMEADESAPETAVAAR